MKIQQGLLVRLFLALALGAVLGSFAPSWVIRATNCFRDLFGQFIKFFVPFIIVGLVTPAITDTGRRAGKMLLLTMGIAYASTLFAGFFAYGIASGVFPHWLSSGSLEGATAAKTFPAFFSLKIPPVMDVMTALATSFLFGLGIVAAGADNLARAAASMRDVVMIAIAKVFVPLLPLYILTVMADLAASGRIAAVGGGGVRIMALALVTTSTVLAIQYIVAGIVARRNPLKAFWTMLPAYLTGWGCCSSAATIPYTLRQTKANGVSDETADLVIPLCATVHLSGSMSNLVIYAAGIMILAGGTMSLGAFTQYILMLSVIAVAAPGVPGGAVIASAAAAESALGFSPENFAIMVAFYMALDGMGTAVNLTGDGAVALIVDRFRQGRPGARSGGEG